jgi:ribosomal protein L40E
LFTVTELLEAVEQMGILTERPLVLYTQPRSIHIHRSGYDYRWCNSLVDAVEQLFRTIDAEAEIATEGTKSTIIVLASDTCHACVKIETKKRGWTADEWGNYSARITIWAPADFTPQIVQRLLQAQYGDPIGRGIDWIKIEETWKIRRADAVAQWRSLMADTRLSGTKPSSDLVLAAMVTDSGIRVCRNCGTRNSEFALFCARCGASIEGRD